MSLSIFIQIRVAVEKTDGATMFRLEILVDVNRAGLHRVDIQLLTRRALVACRQCM